MRSADLSYACSAILIAKKEQKLKSFKSRSSRVYMSKVWVSTIKVRISAKEIEKKEKEREGCVHTLLN